MKLGKLEGIVPNRRACFDLLCLLENEYNCSIKLWLDANNPRGGEIGWTIYASGSGFVFDLPDLDCFVGQARVLDAENGNLYSALWQCLLQLERRFHSARFVNTYVEPEYVLGDCDNLCQCADCLAARAERAAHPVEPA